MTAAPLDLAWRRGLRPAPRLTVSEWADRYRILPQRSSAEPGRWRTARTPYLREIQDCLGVTSDVREVVFMKGAQVGGTEAILNSMGYAIDIAPGPMMGVAPTVEMAKRTSRQRIDPMLESTPTLKGRVAQVRERDRSNTMLTKEFDRGILILTGANSAASLRSMPVQWLLLDEIDAYPADADDEGDPVDLAEARQRTFTFHKRIKVSTPTLEGYSPIARAFARTDQRRYYVPCPQCGERQPLDFDRLWWRKLDRPPEGAVYACRACDALWPEHVKPALLEAGRWVPEATALDPRVRGYHLSALYSPLGWLSWADIARQHERSYKHPERHRVFTNTVLGLPWKARGEATAPELLMRRREPYPIGTCPAGVLFLTAGVDVQKDRLVYEVVGWGREKTSWSIDYGVLPGDTADLKAGAWVALAALQTRVFPAETGVPQPIRLMAVDSGYNTRVVYSWVAQYPADRVIAIKGQDAGALLVQAPQPIEVSARGKTLTRGTKVWPVGGHVAKSELYGFLRLEIPVDGGPPPPGYCHFPEYGEDYFRELTAEQLTPHTTRRGYVRLEWTKFPGRDNHALDARVYARAAAAVVGLDRLQEADWATLERATGQMPAVVTATASVAPTAPTPTKPRRPWLGDRPRGGWLR